MAPASSTSPLEGSGAHHWPSAALEEASNGFGNDMVAAAVVAAAANGGGGR